MDRPTVSPWLRSWFRWYARRYIRRHFHALRMGPLPVNFDEVRTDEPLIVIMNHASWWDPLTAFFLADHFWPNRPVYAPMDAAALRRYPFFRRLGVFGVELGSVAGALTFLRTSLEILRASDSILWLTPQARFADVRERPIIFAPGLAHLVRRLDRGRILPLAVEYVFWEERTPEILARFGPVISAAHLGAGPPDSLFWRLPWLLQVAMDLLKEDVVARRLDGFETLLSGRVGVGGMYDLWRRLRAAVSGTRFEPHHGRPV
ncbi:MAG: lysophospholipid acyltransferase family protein [Thermogutta sp.]